MTTFEDLPTETRILILQHLASIDLRSFLVSQATCRSLHLLVQEIQSHPHGLPQPTEDEDGSKQRSHHLALSTPATLQKTSLNPVLAHAFAPLFSSAACFTPEERTRSQWFLSLNGDVAKPFRRLPWATGGGDSSSSRSSSVPPHQRRQLREAYLGPGASWRRTSVTLARGPPITRLELVKSYSSEGLNEEGRDHVEHLLVDLPPSRSSSSVGSGGGGGGFLTMGLLYDLLLTHGAVDDPAAATFGAETGAWDLLPGRRLRSYALLLEYECFIPDDEELVDLGPGAEGSAILYVRGGSTVVAGADQDRRFEGGGDNEDGVVGERWVPEMIGDRPKIRPAEVP
ncbi:hypothetical protein KVR01_007153 [Diaporthe batatas]|uniref:uncharacterized protein n=1 Tax=Diaporthe batatas TaxID=748121 RepID=UPI001D050DF9|nr:uncharacterized protein KVR01_007153 [Diaporthe batatas]KAG8162675.1 hypothetical protein KVR01_007153 [Diaporthe batatas]